MSLKWWAYLGFNTWMTQIISNVKSNVSQHNKYKCSFLWLIFTFYLFIKFIFGLKKCLFWGLVWAAIFYFGFRQPKWGKSLVSVSPKNESFFLKILFDNAETKIGLIAVLIKILFPLWFLTFISFNKHLMCEQIFINSTKPNVLLLYL